MELLTVRSASDLLKISRKKLYSLRSCPGIIRIGRSVRIDVDKLLDWARDQTEAKQ